MLHEYSDVSSEEAEEEEEEEEEELAAFVAAFFLPGIVKEREEKGAGEGGEKSW